MSTKAYPLTGGEPSPDLQDLASRYGTYRRAMRMLVLEGKSLRNVQRTVCWEQLALLHGCRPARFVAPEALYQQLCRESSAGGVAPKR
ncbi:MAG: hypothetical protein ER33_06920 [Cyanobium sp. CACIAM 14]|nr:MAG: hypothetical protein ER33_06920 [Cyanobium sp. CACIAM 14]